MKLHVSIKQDDASEHTWTPTQLQRYLTGIMRERGVNLFIHGSDGTRIEVYPQCENCNWYNTVEPIREGFCVDCQRTRRDMS